MAKLLSIQAQIVVPAAVTPASRDLIASEGAQVIVDPSDYDAAVAHAAELAHNAGSAALFIQDTSWEGYETIPMQIVQGYTTLFAEIDDTLGFPPDLVCVPVGVGSLAHSAVLHYASTPTAILTVEPDEAACLLTSLKAGKLTTIKTGSTIMPGLNCGTVSHTAWPDLQERVDAAVTISDAEADSAVRELAALGIDAGPCGAAPLAGVRAALKALSRTENRARLGLHSSATVVLICTEGSEVYLSGKT